MAQQHRMRVHIKNKKGVETKGGIRLPSKQERNKILDSIEERFGVKLNPKTMVERDERIYLYAGEDLPEIKPGIIDLAGLHIGKMTGGEFKPGIEGSQIINPRKNFIDVNQKTAIRWMQGRDIKAGGNEILTPGFVIVKRGDDIMGCGKFDGETIKNHVPKNRRLRYE